MKILFMIMTFSVLAQDNAIRSYKPKTQKEVLDRVHRISVLCPSQNKGELQACKDGMKIMGEKAISKGHELALAIKAARRECQKKYNPKKLSLGDLANKNDFRPFICDIGASTYNQSFYRENLKDFIQSMKVRSKKAI